MQEALNRLLAEATEGDRLGGEEGLTWEEAAEKLGRKGEGQAVEKEVSGGLDVRPDDGRLKLLKRARHVVRLLLETLR